MSDDDDEREECDLEVSESTFMNQDQVKIYGQIWRRKSTWTREGGSDSGEKKVRALVFIVHGLNEHSCFCYQNTVVEPLARIGCVVASHDHMGHGQSEGNRKYLSSVDNLARDVVAHIEILRSTLPDQTPIFLYGHSLGGLVSCLVSLERPDLIQGMVLEAPALFVQDKSFSSGLLFLVARAISLVVPSYILRRPVFSNLSRNPEIVQKAFDDDLRNKDGLTLGTAVSITTSVSGIVPRLKDIQTPFLVAHGQNDSVVSVVASQTLFKEACAKDKSIQVYPDSLHLLRGDSGDVGEDFKARTVQWIKTRIQ